MGLPPRERDRGVPGPSEGAGQRILTHYALSRVAEIGYLPVIRSGGTLFLQRINAVHERASTMLASNMLAGFEKVPLLGGQNVPLGFGRTGSAEIDQGCALD